jgi:RNA polymerase sigma factor (sigma-70 family)
MATAAPEISVPARDRAFESLYRQYVKDVYHYALALLRNPADAEDVTQTTFLNAYRAYSRGVEVQKPQNWLIKIAHNVARTRYARASRRIKEVPLEDHVDQLAVPEETRPDVYGVLEALGRLPFNQRAALVMRELEGRNYSEIADTIGVSVSAVETLIFRARRSLRLKTSSLRTLSVVPLPSSLVHLFDSGGVVAGAGGALVGAGFIAKATVAIVAGLIATGVTSDRTGPASAARDVAAGPSAEQSWSRAQSWTNSGNVRAAKSAQALTPKVPVSGLTLRPHMRRSTGPTAVGPSAGGATSTASGAVALGSATTTTVEAATTPAKAALSTAEQTVAGATAAVPIALPQAPRLPVVAVQVPPPPVQLPSPPVQLPAVPSGTALP